MTRKIFIDVGSHIGQSVDRFYQEIDDADDWDIYCFEPIQFRRLKERLDKHRNIKFIEAAVGIVDGKIIIYPAASGGQGSTVLTGKLTCEVNYDKGKQVDCIDFVHWFEHNVDVEDFVIIKINIEGGEYVLMPRLIEIMLCVNGLHIKLHHNKFRAVQGLKLKKIYENFRLECRKYKTRVLLDMTENPYEFKQLVEASRDS